MSARVAEIRQDAVAAKIAEKAVVGFYDPRARRVKGVEDRRRIFRIKPGRQRRRPHEIADHDRQMPTFRNLRLADPRTLEKLSFAGVGKRPPDGLEKPFSVAQGDLELFEIGFRQLRHHVGVDGVLCEQRLIALETCVSEPLGHIHIVALAETNTIMIFCNTAWSVKLGRTGALCRSAKQVKRLGAFPPQSAPIRTVGAETQRDRWEGPPYACAESRTCLCLIFAQPPSY